MLLSEVFEVVRDTQIVKKPVSEILRLAQKSARKEYVVLEHTGERGLDRVLFKVRAPIGKTWHLGKIEFNMWSNYFGLAIDEKGHPYYRRRFGSFKFREYDWRFLEVYSHACIMGRLPNTELYEVCDIIRKDKKYAWIVREFHRWFQELRRKKQEIKTAKRFEDFEGRRKLTKFSKLERTAAESSKVWAFRYWYVDRLEKEEYLEKSRLSEKEEDEVFKKAVQKFINRIETKGFRLVKKAAREG